MVVGVALLDCDGDGYLDVYLVNGAEIPSLEKVLPAAGGAVAESRTKAGITVHPKLMVRKSTGHTRPHTPTLVAELDD